jgi:hypothetical protein
MVLAFALLAACAGAQQLNSTSYTPAAANGIINRAQAYVDTVNQSGYLVFSPNLTQAYGYLQNAQGVYNRSPSAAVIYANEAVASAKTQYADIRSHWLASLAVMAVLTAVSAIAVIMSMRKVRQRKK